MFVNQPPVAVQDGPNTIYVKAKMDFGTKTAVMDALQELTTRDGTTPNVALHFGAYQVALLQHNVTGWSGPAFQGVPCTPDMIARLDPDEPLVQKALEEIARRNPMSGGTAAEKKELTNAGEPPSPASE